MRVENSSDMAGPQAECTPVPPPDPDLPPDFFRTWERPEWVKDPAADARERIMMRAPKCWPEPVRADQQGPFTIIGGVGGTSARLEDVLRAAQVLETASEITRNINIQCDQLAHEVNAAGSVLRQRLLNVQPDPAQPALLMEASLIMGQASQTVRLPELIYHCSTTAAVMRADMADLARSVRAAEATYRDAEAKTKASFFDFAKRWFDVGMRIQPGGMGLVLKVRDAIEIGLIVSRLKAEKPRKPTDPTIDEDLDNLGQLLAQTVSAIALPPGAGIPFLAANRELVNDKLGVDRVRKMRVENVHGDTREIQPAWSLAGTAAALDRLGSGKPSDAGTVAIQKNTRPDGSRSWVVFVPGTQGGMKEQHGFDWKSNLRIMGGEKPESQDVVEQAMMRAGIGPDEPVALVGHSQGGLVATAIAGAQATGERRFNIKHVATFGSPTAAQKRDPDVEYLGFESATDVVVGADSAPSPEVRNVTAVIVDGTHVTDGDPGTHSMKMYSRVAAEAAALDHPSVRKSIGDFNDFLRTEGEKSVQYYRGQAVK